jgi:hypothetical protein
VEQEGNLGILRTIKALARLCGQRWKISGEDIMVLEVVLRRIIVVVAIPVNTVIEESPKSRNLFPTLPCQLRYH